MDTFTIALWVLRLTFVGLIYLFFILVARALWRDLRAAVAGAGASLGRLIVTTTTGWRPADRNQLSTRRRQLDRS